LFSNAGNDFHTHIRDAVRRPVKTDIDYLEYRRDVFVNGEYWGYNIREKSMSIILLQGMMIG
jgi:hypothetical protein